MYILVSNNHEKKVYSESYDKVIYLGYTPNHELRENEFIINDTKTFILLNNFRISLNGICKGNRTPRDKWDLVEHHIGNQIVLNNSKSNIYDERPDGSKLYFIGLNSHYEIEI